MWLRAITFWAASTALAIGLLTGVAWVIGYGAGELWIPHLLSSMLFMVAAAELYAAGAGRERVRQGCALLLCTLVVIGAALLLLRGLPGPHDVAASLPTVVGFAFVATSMALCRHYPALAHRFTGAAGIVVLTGVCGWLLAVQVSASLLAGMAPITLAALGAICLGLVAQEPERAPASWLTRNASGARLARHLVVAVIAIPLGLGWVLRGLQHVAGLDAEAGQALFVAATIVTLGAVLAAVVDRLDRAELIARQERHAARAELAHREAQFRAAFRNAPIGSAVATPDGRFLRVNPALCAMSGYDEQQLLALAPLGIVHPADRPAIVRQFSRPTEDGADTVTLQHRILTPSGDERFVETRVTWLRDSSGALAEALLQLLDVTDRHRREVELRRLADHDALTGLLNRRALQDRLQRRLSNLTRTGGAVMLFDLDGFKSVNDTLGHAAGDELLVGVARALDRRLRDDDLIARLGGDEFAIVLPRIERTAIERVAADLVTVVREQAATVDGRHPGMVTVSIGITELAPGVSAETLLDRADRAMYAAKAAGKNGYAIHRSGLPAARPERGLLSESISW